MFARTMERALRIVPSTNIVVVANRRHSSLVRKDAPAVKGDNLILEPFSRNTAPAVILAAKVLFKKKKDALMVVLPADQYIHDESSYIDAVRKGIDFVNNHRKGIVVLATRPTEPSTAYGYVRLRRAKCWTRRAEKVKEFIEKPDLSTAKRYLRNKRYLWNTGAFIFSASGILDAARRLVPGIYDTVTGNRDIGKMYERLPDISIDYAVMERASNIYCVMGEYGWQDMGSFESLKSILKRESRRFVSRGGKIVKII